MIIVGDCRERLRDLPERSVQTCVTSPPYFGLRDYGHAGQIGLESAPDEFVAALVGVFREVRRVLRDDGTVWLNLGDSYAASIGGVGNNPSSKSTLTTNNGRGPQPGNKYAQGNEGRPVRLRHGVKPKDLIGIPWMVAFALRADGWYLRSDIIWAKPNPMPESVTDRPTKAHEYLFLLSKGPRYFYDADAIREAQSPESVARRGRGDWRGKEGWAEAYHGNPPLGLARQSERPVDAGANKRTVWTVATQPFPGAHFATFPPKLIEPCILAGSAPGDVVLDPFAGAGTVGVVCGWHGREHVGLELNAEYAAMAEARIALEGRAGGRPAHHEPAKVAAEQMGLL